ncbi:MAG: Rieske 2Fe-2S domain-containing protein, partial [Gammaproteobacteria bacterium]|nr:Rieske 2Fe-2S domain-containing protein [Gammaproteobacteria bacterium]
MTQSIRQLTREENIRLTQTGASTPMGETLRRYWWAVGISADLKDRPTFIRVLREDLVLFRDGTGQLGLIDAYCAHRRANLCLGIVEQDGLRCRYHGWKYAVDGTVLRTPGEPKDSDLGTRVEHKAYPVQELGGIVFAYLGPEPAPPVPRYDFLVDDGERHVAVLGFSESNWLQNVENGMDPFHASFTHATTWDDLEVGPDFLRFEETEHGIAYHAYQRTGRDDVFLRREHHLVMPGISVGAGGLLRGTHIGGEGGMIGGVSNLERRIKLPTSARFTTPIDDTHAIMIRINWKPAESPVDYKRDPKPNAGAWNAYSFVPYKEYREAEDAELGYAWSTVIDTQDAIVLDSIGKISDRENENLSVIDQGIVMFREM